MDCSRACSRVCSAAARSWVCSGAACSAAACATVAAGWAGPSCPVVGSVVLDVLIGVSISGFGRRSNARPDRLLAW
jgi:hypothetical protein